MGTTLCTILCAQLCVHNFVQNIVRNFVPKFVNNFVSSVRNRLRRNLGGVCKDGVATTTYFGETCVSQPAAAAAPPDEGSALVVARLVDVGPLVDARGGIDGSNIILKNGR